METQRNEQGTTPAWVERMRERGVNVREPEPGFVLRAYDERGREAGFLLVLWRKTVRLLRGERAVR
ncbi:MAG TPA: hypothetical protein VGB92_10175 [Longimicrobium sp.]